MLKQPRSDVVPLGHLGVRRSFAKGTAAVLLTSLMVTAPATATAEDTITSKAAADPAVISEWNEIAQKTLLADTTKAVPADFLYMGFVHAAVYNAVVGIQGRYEPYDFPTRGPKGASPQAAAIAAAHKILVTYSPEAQHADLNTFYTSSLAKIADSEAKTQGITFGKLAADTLITQRKDDGRNANISFNKPPAPGVWRPTPAPNTPFDMGPFAVPWLGSVTPLLVESGAQFGEPGPPPELKSGGYAKEFNEVKALGSAASTQRTTQQTNIAKFYSGNALVQLNAALRDQVTVRQLDIVDAARMFGAVNMSMADSMISIWHSKMTYGFWRPITAIQQAGDDSNSATAPDPTWQPLLPTPPYPDYVSGYSGLMGAFARGLRQTFHTQDLQLSLTSTAVPDVKRTYDSEKAVCQDVVDARVWLGIHFRSADVRGAKMGQQVADWALDHYFKPVSET
jgi:hypothetical protein